MMELKRIFEASLEKQKEELIKIREEKGSVVLGEVTVDHIFKGMRGVPQTYTATSHVNPQEGVFYRGRPLKEVNEILPKLEGTDYPPIEAVFWFLLTGEIPTLAQVKNFINDLHMHACVPYHVYNVMGALPKKTRPMARFCSGILAMASISDFQDLYDRGKIAKNEYWKYAFDDSIKLIANLSQITSFIYRIYCQDKDQIESNPNLDWAANLSYMMGYSDSSTQDLFRMFLFTHADHSASNVSAHTAHTVGSALSNVFYTLGASMLGLAGPLHGYANEQTVMWLLALIKDAKGDGELENDISEKYIKRYISKTLAEGRVIPGYGHSALRVEDPRFSMFYERYNSNAGFNTPLLKAVEKIYKILPDMLREGGKVSNPNPNIDAISGSCLYSEGIVEHNFYTVLFGMSRLFGILAQHVQDRAVGQPIFRPKTISLDMLREL